MILSGILVTQLWNFSHPGCPDPSPVRICAMHSCVYFKNDCIKFISWNAVHDQLTCEARRTRADVNVLLAVTLSAVLTWRTVARIN